MNTRIPSPKVFVNTASGIGAAILLTQAAMTSALADGTITGGLSADQIVQKAKETYATLASYSDEGQIVDPVGGATTRFTSPPSRRLMSS